jgi:hypothetical protein
MTSVGYQAAERRYGAAWWTEGGGDFSATLTMQRA